jgi:NAD(P)H-quinone oxidoreductase subunit 5
MALLIWTLVTFLVRLLVVTEKLFKGFEYHSKFSLLCLGFTFSHHVMTMWRFYCVNGFLCQE